MEMILQVMSSSAFLTGWLTNTILAFGILIYDLRRNDAAMGSLAKWVWGFTLIYSGLLGGVRYNTVRDAARSVVIQFGYGAFVPWLNVIPGAEPES